ncbi:HtrA protease/chaperone protein [Klebsiella pneumoniae]|uniref:peptidase Do n=1 Tax=Klebsiella pneumoniae TaxID=573 RepID=A0A378FVD5_KLEPN|nr:HtrA protease/chaperone protein [Klebsiella pneumoniae]
MVKNLTEQMVKYGQVKRGELGIMGTELNSELAKAMKVDAQRGAFVSQVMPGSAAAKAGIKAGDVITSLNGESDQQLRRVACPGRHHAYRQQS